jgi:hypothetical protein
MFYRSIKITNWTGEVAQVVSSCLASMSSNPSAEKRKKKVEDFFFFFPGYLKISHHHE